MEYVNYIYFALYVAVVIILFINYRAVFYGVIIASLISAFIVPLLVVDNRTIEEKCFDIGKATSHYRSGKPVTYNVHPDCEYLNSSDSE